MEASRVQCRGLYKVSITHCLGRHVKSRIGGPIRPDCARCLEVDILASYRECAGRRAAVHEAFTLFVFSMREAG